MYLFFCAHYYLLNYFLKDSYNLVHWKFNTWNTFIYAHKTCKSDLQQEKKIVVLLE